jgi:hypothetical protein
VGQGRDCGKIEGIDGLEFFVDFLGMFGMLREAVAQES